MEAATLSRPRAGVPDRSVQQRMDALVIANRVRSNIAQAKRDVKCGRRTLADVLDDPGVASAKLVALLLALPKVGRVKANRWIVTCRVSPSKTVGGLTARQRAELLSMLPRGV